MSCGPVIDLVAQGLPIRQNRRSHGAVLTHRPREKPPKRVPPLGERLTAPSRSGERVMRCPERQFHSIEQCDVGSETHKNKAHLVRPVYLLAHGRLASLGWPPLRRSSRTKKVQGMRRVAELERTVRPWPAKRWLPVAPRRRPWLPCTSPLVMMTAPEGRRITPE